MSVPLDRLYHYLDDCVNHDLVIYRWMPHGSRKLEDLKPITNYSKFEFLNYPALLCHDQEPLISNFYSRDQIKNVAKNILLDIGFDVSQCNLLLNYHADQYIRGALACSNQFDLTMLLHSEQHSTAVTWFSQNGFVPVYYWGHAVIAHDWFRYAEHDPNLNFDLSDIKQDFLVYNRAWSGTREYRLYFVEQLINHQLLDHVRTTFNSVDQQHYTQHVFKNSNFKILNHSIEKYLPANQTNATASADYNNNDYNTTGIEVVLETLFDDSRWHLTEKTLRPIACGKPFILAATPGSLQYLRNYGFETFAGVIDESYDTIANSQDRLKAIIQEMKRIAGLDVDAKQRLYTKLHEIAQRNKQRFFNGLFDQVINEYKTNLDQAMDIMQQHRTGQHRAAIRQLLQQN
jgi:hypothetical protein